MTPLNRVLEIIKPLPTELLSLDMLIDHISHEKPYTLCQIEAILSVVNAIETLSINNINGVFFEVGVWRGGMAAIMQHVNEILCTNQEIYEAVYGYEFWGEQIHRLRQWYPKEEDEPVEMYEARIAELARQEEEDEENKGNKPNGY